MALLSGKFVLRLDPSMHQSLKEEALVHDMSLNEWIIHKLGEGSPPVKNELIDSICDIFHPDIIAIVMFGSAVRREMTSRSDVDLLLVLKSSRSVDRSLYQLWDERVVGRISDTYSPQFVHLPSNNFSSLWLEVAMEGEVLFDLDGKTKSVLQRIRMEIASGRYVRKVSHGHSYWVKEKLDAK